METDSTDLLRTNTSSMSPRKVGEVCLSARNDVNELLYNWQVPGTLVAQADKLRDSLGKQALFREGTSFREAYIAGKFGIHLGADFVRLLRPGSQPTPDFALQFEESELWFESTEADRPSRKRNLEYLESTTLEGTRLLRDDEWVDQSIYAREIDRLCRQKSAKNYGKCDGLIINSNAFGIIGEELMDEEWWRKSASTALVNFDQVWRFHRSTFERIVPILT